MKKLVIIFFGASAVLLSGCLKSDPPTDFSTLGVVVEVESPQFAGNAGIGSGLEYFNDAQLQYPASDALDSVQCLNNILSPNTLGQPVATTVTVDPAALEANLGNDSITYTLMPDSDFTILYPTGVIPAGTRLDTFTLEFFPGKFDQTQNLMLPVTVATTPNYTISGNFGHIYFHNIGIAGVYSVSGTRYTYTGSSGWTGMGAYPTPTSTVNLATAVDSSLAPVLGTGPLAIGLTYADLGTTLGYNWNITYNGVTSITPTPNAALGAATNFNIWTATLSFSGKAIIHLVTSYTDAGGNDNIVDETYTQH
jgi:hypothetical protein